jgi:hypothetical protein
LVPADCAFFNNRRLDHSFSEAQMAPKKQP